MDIGILYARYSPRPTHSDSIGQQMSDIVAWCEQHEIAPRGFYFDPEVSGSVPFFRRPGLAAALEDLGVGELFVVRNLNRAALSLSVALGIEEEIERKKAILVSVEHGGAQATKDQDKYAWGMRMMAYIWYEIQRLEINERTSRRFKQRIAADLVAGGCSPIGRRRNGMALELDEEEDVAVTAILQGHEAGWSPGRICDYLRRAGISPRGEKWHRETIRRVIRRNA